MGEQRPAKTNYSDHQVQVHQAHTYANNADHQVQVHTYSNNENADPQVQVLYERTDRGQQGTRSSSYKTVFLSIFVSMGCVAIVVVVLVRKARKMQ